MCSHVLVYGTDFVVTNLTQMSQHELLKAQRLFLTGLRIVADFFLKKEVYREELIQFSLPGSCLLLCWLLSLIPLLVTSIQGEVIQGDIYGPSRALTGASHLKLKVILVALVIELQINLVEYFVILCLTDGVTLCN